MRLSPNPVGPPGHTLSAAAWLLLAGLVAGCQTPSAPEDPPVDLPAPGVNTGSPTIEIPQLAGDYTLTIGGGVCKWSPLPWEFMNRTYGVSLAQSGPLLYFSFTDAAFEGYPQGKSPVVSGQIDPLEGVVTFELPRPLIGWWNEFEEVWAPVTERLPDGSRLEMMGSVRATLEPPGVSGTFNGTFHYLAASPPARSGSCESDHHRFTLTR